MASNPVSAFMQGFAVVDNLENNREERKWRGRVCIKCGNETTMSTNSSS
jgi:hypothetical protein